MYFFYYYFNYDFEGTSRFAKPFFYQFEAMVTNNTIKYIQLVDKLSDLNCVAS